MDAESFTLLALVPPGSAEAEVGRLQAGIFAAQGLLSAMAMPPLVPIAFIATPPPEGAQSGAGALLGELEHSVHAPWRITVGGPAWVSGWLYLGIDSGGMWAGLRSLALARCGGEMQAAPFPAAEGFFLGCGEATPQQRQEIAPAASALSFSSGDLALVRVRTVGSGAWWKDVDWETIDERPLRGRRQR
jgi:hypothetical protein